MAQDAELKLKVSLDLAFFRQQLSTIGTRLGGQALQLNVKFDKKSIADQYRLLDRYLGRKTFKTKIESPTLDALVTKVEKLKENLGKLAGEKISLDVEVASNIDDVRKSIKDKLPAIGIKTELAEPVNVDDFIRDVAKKVDDQVKRSYTAGGVPIATKLTLPGLTDPLKALQKNLNQKDPLRAKLGTVASIKKTDVTALQAAVNEKFKDITVKVRAELDTAAAATQGPATGSSRTFLQTLKDLDKAVLQSVYRAAGEDALLAFDEGIINNKTKMIQALSRAAEDASDGFIAALENKKSALFKAAGEYGGALLGGLKKTLKIQSPSREMFDIGDDAGKGFELGLLKAMELAEKSATNQMRRMLDRLARMALMMGGMSAEQINRQVAQARALPGLDFPATVPPRQRIPIGPSSTGRALPAGRAAAGLIGAAQGPAGLLPSMTKQSELTMGLEALVQALVSQSRGRGPEGPGAIVSMESGFIPAMRERFAKAAERYLFGVETQVVDLFDAALRQVESAVDLYIARIQGQISQRMRSAVSVTDLGVQGRPMLPGAITGRTPLMLPPAGGTTPIGQMRFNAVRTGQFEPPTPLMLPPAGGTTPPSQMRFNAVSRGAFPTDGMHIPSTELPSRYLKGRELINTLKASEKYLQQAKVPLAGAIQELSGEFGNAVKQVLLFGTAYKALAFITNLPGEALSAATSLQTFRNQLQAVTGGAAQAEEAFSFVGNIASQLNVPLDSAREGFVRLYASMSPAGIGGADIENLFVGISKAAATFGMGTDEVNRMTNAFAQMASKGSLSAEEVKNQLGDVLPGALSLFARAAQMDIGTFLKAMEDGQFKAEAMGQVLRNVGKLMNTDFGGAAAGAANTLQGAMNGLANSVKTMYESFEPLVKMIGSTVFPQLSSLINDAAEAVQAFTAGMQGAADPSAQLSTNGKAIYDALLQVAEIGKSLQGIISNLGPTFLNLGKGLLTVVEYVVRFMNTGLGGWLTKTAVQVGVLTAALQLLSSAGIGAAIRGLIALITNFKAAIAQMRAMIATSKLLRFALIGIAGTVVLQGLELLASRMDTVSDSIRNIAAEARQAKKDLDAMAAAGQIAEIQGRKQILGEELQSIEKATKILERMRGGVGRISRSEFERLQQTGLAAGISYRQSIMNPSEGTAVAMPGQVQTNLEAAQRRRVALLNQLGDADEAEAEASRQAVMASERNQRLEKVTLDASEEKQKNGRALSIDELLGGRIKRNLDKRRKDLEEALQSELNRVAGFDNAEQAERMVRTAAELLDIRYQINAIDETILGREKVRERFIASQSDKASAALAFDEQTNDLKAARVNLETDIEIAILKQRGAAEKQAREDAAALADKIQKQKELNRLVEDAKIAAGIIPPQQAAIIQQQRGFEDARARVQAEGTPEQLSQLLSAQALIPEAGSIQETIKTLRDELDKLTSSQEMVRFSALSIGEAFSTSFKDAITGASSAQEALAGFFQSVANSFADMAAQMINKWLQMQLLGLAQSLLPGISSFAGGAKIGQAVNMPTGVGMGAGGGILQNAGGQGFGTFGPNFGIRQFANGGLVTGPTMGLIGEGRYNEAVVPLPDGKTIPVDLGGASTGSPVNVVVNVDAKGTDVQGSDQRGNELGRAISSAVQQELIKQQRPGGLLAGRR